jgi:hypothetical protein
VFERENYIFVFDQKKMKSKLKKDFEFCYFSLIFASFPSIRSGRNSLEIGFNKKGFQIIEMVKSLA